MHVTPELWDNATDEGKAALTAAPDPEPSEDWPLGLTIPDWTTYTKDQIIACKGPGESDPTLHRDLARGCRLRRHPRATLQPMPATRTGRTPMTDLLLDATGVAKHYGAVAALRNASLAVRPGEVHALMGANGAGKSTLVKILTGAVRPDARHDPRPRRAVRRPLPGRGPPRRARLGLPGTVAHPRPRHRARTCG